MGLNHGHFTVLLDLSEAISRAEENGLRAGGVGSLDVYVAIADHKGASQVDVQVASGLQKHSRPGLAALAIGFRFMRAIVDRIQPRIPAGKLCPENFMHL